MKMVSRDGGAKDVEQNTLTGNLKINEMIRLILERWYFYNPRVLVLFEPFIMCDAQGISIVKAYIRKFAQRGTAVIICQSRMNILRIFQTGSCAFGDILKLSPLF